MPASAESAARIAVVGSYNVGLTFKVPRLPVEGETLLGKSYIEGPGGKGSNQAIAAARLGADVRFIGCIGSDAHGDDALRLWEREGVQSHVKRDDQSHTGVGAIYLLPEGDNAIIVAPGANNTLTPEDIDELESMLANCQTLLLQLEINLDTAIHAIHTAKRLGLTVILNPAPVQPLPEDVFQHINVLTPNETEARVLLGERPDADVSAESLAKKLLNLGVGAVVLTQGKAGALVATPENVCTVTAPQVRTVDPTGAGDAFNGALAVGLAEGKPIVEAAQWACYGGAYCATKLEVIPGLPTREQLEGLKRKHA